VKGTTLSSKEVFVPNVFTPNGDGRNDILFVYGNYITNMQLRIFNQWGQLVFVTAAQSVGWNGTYGGKQQPVGVYAYTLKAWLQDGTIVNKKGSINLIR
jgi:gliding motility-associated-like protein